MRVKVVRWGRSLAIRLPAAMVHDLRLKPGDDIDIRIAAPEPIGRDEASCAEALRRLREFRGLLPANLAFDRDEANPR